MKNIFRKFSAQASRGVGSPWAFIVAFSIIIAWAIIGPLFNFSNTWQLMINTGTTISTFLMVFLIQNTQNRDAKAIHLKLDELVKSIRTARNTIVDVENATDEEIELLEREFQKFHEKAMKRKEKK